MATLTGIRTREFDASLALEDQATLAAIDGGIADADAGRTIPEEEVREFVAGWIFGILHSESAIADLEVLILVVVYYRLRERRRRWMKDVGGTVQTGPDILCLIEMSWITRRRLLELPAKLFAFLMLPRVSAAVPAPAVRLNEFMALSAQL